MMLSWELIKWTKQTNFQEQIELKEFVKKGSNFPTIRAALSLQWAKSISILIKSLSLSCWWSKSVQIIVILVMKTVLIIQKINVLQDSNRFIMMIETLKKDFISIDSDFTKKVKSCLFMLFKLLSINSMRRSSK